jgi:hypothetical protein
MKMGSMFTLWSYDEERRAARGVGEQVRRSGGDCCPPVRGLAGAMRSGVRPTHDRQSMQDTNRTTSNRRGALLGSSGLGWIGVVGSPQRAVLSMSFATPNPA